MATIKKTSAGSYFVSIYDNAGKRIRKTFTTKSDAKAFIKRQENFFHDSTQTLNNGQFVIKDEIHNFLESKRHLRKKTVSRYEYILNRLISFVSDKNIVFLDEFTSDHASQFASIIKQPYPDPRDSFKTINPRPKTINFGYQLVRAFFSQQVEMGHIMRSPFLHIKNVKTEKRKPEFYTEDELKAFFSQEMHDVYRNAFMALLHTGMRINELIHITWEDVDLKQRLMRVRPNEHHALKTENAERTIPVNDVLYNLILGIAANRKSAIYPFCSVEGKKLRDRRLLAICKEIGKVAGIKGRVFLHKFRHTFATHLIKRRVPIEVVQKLLGHYSINQTMIYLHIRSEEFHSDVSLLNDLGGEDK